MATTTPPLRPIVEPPTPLHGPKYDNYEPYEPRRRSTRLRTLRTPSPAGVKISPVVSAPATSSRITRSGIHNLSPPSSPLSPESRPRKRVRANVSESNNMAAEQSKPAVAGLPTPVKTPRKKEVKGGTKPAARVLFPHRLDHVEDPTPKKKSKKIGFSLDSPSASSDGKIEIFEDSKDKIPEIDEAPDNPFYITKPETRAKRSKRKNEASEKDQNKDIQRILENDEGMIYVFRGKKIFRKFDEDYDALPSAEAMGGLPTVDGPATPHHYTRSSVKPRFLFPARAPAHTGDTTDEEAITETDLPTKGHDLTTPAKKRAYATPPTTARATRIAAAKRAAANNPDPSANGAGPEGAADDEAGSPFAVRRAQRSPLGKGKRASSPPPLLPLPSGKGRKRAAGSPSAEAGAKKSKSRA